MDITGLLIELRRHRIELWVNGENLRFKPKEAVTGDLLEALRQNKTKVIRYLSHDKEEPAVRGYSPQNQDNLSYCHNPLTPHSSHEFPWEYDPYSCYCYKEFGYPRFCQGAPCRWVFPNHGSDRDHTQSEKNESRTDNKDGEP